VELVADGCPISTAWYYKLTKGQRKEKMARGASYHVTKLYNKPKLTEINETEEPELGAQARVSARNGKLDSVSWGENGARRWEQLAL
jgi:hypothetical protein